MRDVIYKEKVKYGTNFQNNQSW